MEADGDHAWQAVLTGVGEPSQPVVNSSRAPGWLKSVVSSRFTRGASCRQVPARRRDDGARCGTKHHALYSSGMKRNDSAITHGSGT